MTILSRPSVNPEWRQFLRLEEELLDQPSIKAQCNLIIHTLKEWGNWTARVWLAKPFYPIPGEMYTDILPTPLAHDVVLDAYQKHRICISNETTDQTGQLAAIPLLTHKNLLGVIQIQNIPGKILTEKDYELLSGLANHAAVAMQITRQVAIKNWRAEQLALVRSVSNQIANVMELDELCVRVTRLIQETFNFYHVAIFTIDPKSNFLHFQASASQVEASEKLPQFDVEIGQGIIGHVAKTGEEMLAQNIKQEPLFRFIESLPNTHSEIAIPLKIENRILGVFDIQNDQENGFHEVDLLVLRTLADNIASAVEGATLYDDLQRRANQIKVVLEISHFLNSILDLDELLEQTVKLIRSQFGYPYVHLFTVHPIRRKVMYRTGSGSRSKFFQDNGLLFDLDDPRGIIPHVARTGKTKLVNNVHQEPLYRESEFQPNLTNSELTIPLVFAKEVQGVLDIQSAQINAFDQNDQSLLESIAASLATAIHNANLFRAERWRRQVADSFRDVAGLISANIALDELLDTILIKLENNLPCEVSAIWLLDETHPDLRDNAKKLRLAAARGVPTKKITEALTQSEEASRWLSSALSQTAPIIRNPSDPYGPLGVSMNFASDYSSIAAPLFAGTQPLGIITLGHHTTGRYGGEAKAMTSTFASYAAVAIQNARFYAESQEQAWVSTVLLQVSEASQAAGSVDELLDTITRLTPLLVGVKNCAIFLREEERSAFILQAAYGIELPKRKPVFLERKTPAFSRLSSTCAPIFIHDIASELGVLNANPPIDHAAIVMLPLLARGKLMGALMIAHSPASQTGAQTYLGEQTLSILQGIAHQTSTAMENLRLMEARQEEGYVTAVLLQVAQTVANQNDLDDILDTIIHLMPILVGIDACAVYLFNSTSDSFRIQKVFTGNRQQEEELNGTFYKAQNFKLLDAVRKENQLYFSPLNSPNVQPNDWPAQPCFAISNLQPPSAFPGNNWLWGFPLSIKGDVAGVLVTKETGSSPTFREKRLEIINGIAQQISLAIQNDKLTKDLVERERLEKEIQLARQIQQTFLPGHLPELDHWQIATRWQTARTVGGDFYDIFELGNNKVCMVVADVSDKGLAAALYMTVTRTLIRANIQNSASPATILERVNNLLYIDSQDGMFVTVALAILDTQTGGLVYANAGHNRPLLIHKGSPVIMLPKGGIALGVLENINLEDHVLTIQADDYLLFYTDGVTETFSPSGTIFGENLLIETLQECNTQSAKQVLDNLEERLKVFRNNAPPSDDLTLLLIHRA